MPGTGLKIKQEKGHGAVTMCDVSDHLSISSIFSEFKMGKEQETSLLTAKEKDGNENAVSNKENTASNGRRKHHAREMDIKVSRIARAQFLDL